MPRKTYTITDKLSGRTIDLVDETGIAPPPTNNDVQFHFDKLRTEATQPKIPESLAPPPGNLGSLDYMKDSPLAAQAGGTAPKAPGWETIAKPVGDFMSRPIASYLPQWMQDKLATRHNLNEDTRYGVPGRKLTAADANYDEFPASEGLWKGAAQHVNPTHIVAAASLGTGIPGVAANSLLAGQGLVKAAAAQNDPSERLGGILEAVGGGTGVAGALPKAGRQISKGVKYISEANAAGKASAARPAIPIKDLAKVNDEFEKAIAIKYGKTFPEQLQADYKLGMEGKESRHALYDEVAAAQTKAKVEADKASGTLSHYNDITDEEALKEAALQAKRLSLAKSGQALDEVAAKAGGTPNYFTPAEKPAGVVGKSATSAPQKAAVEAQIAQTERHLPGQVPVAPPPKPPSVDDVMFMPLSAKVPPKSGVATPAPVINIADKKAAISPTGDLIPIAESGLGAQLNRAEELVESGFLRGHISEEEHLGFENILDAIDAAASGRTHVSRGELGAWEKQLTDAMNRFKTMRSESRTASRGARPPSPISTVTPGEGILPPTKITPPVDVLMDEARASLGIAPKAPRGKLRATKPTQSATSKPISATKAEKFDAAVERGTPPPSRKPGDVLARIEAAKPEWATPAPVKATLGAVEQEAAAAAFNEAMGKGGPGPVEGRLIANSTLPIKKAKRTAIDEILYRRGVDTSIMSPKEVSTLMESIAREMGGVDAEARMAPANVAGDIDPAEIARIQKQRAELYKASGADKGDRVVQGEIVDPNKLYSGIDPALLGKAWKNPLARSAIGGTVGYNVAPEEHKGKGAIAGAVLGSMAAPVANQGFGLPTSLGSLKAGARSSSDFLNSARYESLLLGAPQLSNIAGNVGGALSAPVIEALRGNYKGAGQLLARYASPKELLGDLGKGIKEGWFSKAPITRFGQNVNAVGPAGKALRAVDMGTKRMLAGGGLSPELAGHYTGSASPSTKIGKIGEKLQNIKGVNLITPFSRTATKMLEMGAAMSPLRWENPILRGAAGGAAGYGLADDDNKLLGTLTGAGIGAMTGGGGKALREMIPTEGTGAYKLAHEIMLGMPSVVAEEAGRRGYGPKSTLGTAALGPFAAPYAIGRGIRDYKKYGRDDPRDVTRSISNNVPFLGDVPRLMDDPTKVFRNIPAQLIPQASMMIGDKTVRDTNSVEDAIKEKLPSARTELPAKRDYAGEPLVRNIFGQYPLPIYERDPMMNQLADKGLIRREQSGSLGSPTAAEELKAYIEDKKREASPVEVSPAMQSLIDIVSPGSRHDITPMEASRLQEFRGKSMVDMIKKMMASQPYNKADERLSTILLKLAKEEGTKRGTEDFKAERIINANKKAKP